MFTWSELSVLSIRDGFHYGYRAVFRVRLQVHPLRLRGRLSTSARGSSRHLPRATPTCSSGTLRECGMSTRSLPRRHGRRRNRSFIKVPLSLRRRLLHVRYDGQYVFQVSPVDSGGRMSSIARSPFPRISLRGFCFRACVCRFFLLCFFAKGVFHGPPGDTRRRCR